MALAIVWLLLIVVAFWFLIVRPQRRRMVEMRVLQQALEVGDEIVTSAGLYGVIQSLDDTTVLLEIAPGTVVKLARGAVVQKAEDEAAAPEVGPEDDTGPLSD